MSAAINRHVADVSVAYLFSKQGKYSKFKNAIKLCGSSLRLLQCRIVSAVLSPILVLLAEYWYTSISIPLVI